MKRILIIIMLVMIVIAARAEEIVWKGTAEELTQLFYENPEKADEYFTGKKIEVTGYIESFTINNYIFYIRLYGFLESYTVIADLDFLTKKQRDLLYEDHAIKITGFFDYIIGDTVFIKEALIK